MSLGPSEAHWDDDELGAGVKTSTLGPGGQCSRTTLRAGRKRPSAPGCSENTTSEELRAKESSLFAAKRVALPSPIDDSKGHPEP